MKKLIFNLKESGFDKQAMNDGAKPGMMKARQFANCQKLKLDQKMDPQEAWESCLKEYQEKKNKSDWAKQYS